MQCTGAVTLFGPGLVRAGWRLRVDDRRRLVPVRELLAPLVRIVYHLPSVSLSIPHLWAECAHGFRFYLRLPRS